MAFDLALVMPVYNEEEIVSHVLSSWVETLDGLGLEYRLIVLNDGSRDGTAQVLQGWSQHPRCQVINKPNSGHGPTILQGYRLAVGLAPWVFQCDSDDEIESRSFPALWAMRQQCDAVFGVRAGRRQDPARRLISAGSRWAVRLLCGPGLQDVNTPYRLMRSPVLARLLPQIPPDTFAPNVIIAGALARARLRIGHCQVPHLTRRTGQASLWGWKLYRNAFKSLWQTVRCRPTL